jgi:hypothetical protein
VGVRGLVGKLLTFGVSLGVALTAADAIVRLTDLGFRPLRNGLDTEAILESSEFRTRVRTNALGFREPRLPGPKPPGVRRIVALGDSFTQGYGVEEDEAYPRLLEGLLDGVEVINLGVGASCPLDYAANFEEVGRAYEPDLVLVGLMTNDVSDVFYLREHGARLLSALLHAEQNRLTDPRPFWKRLPSRLWPNLYALAGFAVRRPQGGAAPAARKPEDGHVPSPPLLPRERWKEVLDALTARYGNGDEVERRLATLPPERLDRIQTLLTVGRESAEENRGIAELAALLEPRYYIDRLELAPKYDAAWKETTRLLARIAASARRVGAETIVVYIPSAQEIVPSGLQRLAHRGFEVDDGLPARAVVGVRLRQFGAEAGIPVVDLSEPLRAHADEPIYFRHDSHWTPRGHRVAAEAIAAAIAAQWER